MTHAGSDAARDADERGLARLLTFVDAIAAIAITLLVLPLVELSSDVTEGESTTELLHAHVAQLWSFGLSFGVIAMLWLGQHRVLAHVVRSHPRVVQVLLVWSLTVVFLPFPTALVASPAGEQTPTKALYVGTILLSSALLLVLDRAVLAHPEITDGAGLPDPRRAALGVGVIAVAFVLMVAVPAVGYYPMLALALLPVLLHLLPRR